MEENICELGVVENHMSLEVLIEMEGVVVNFS